MQIDFHDAVTYVIVRLAGFDHDAADIISYAAQYVDDAMQYWSLGFKSKRLPN
jgi:hypothetical protein